MNVVIGILIVLHLIGWATVFGGALSNMRAPRIPEGMLPGALTALFTGVFINALYEMGDGPVNNIKISIKLVVAVIITVMVIVGRRDKDRVTSAHLGGIAGLTALNVAIAVLW